MKSRGYLEWKCQIVYVRRIYLFLTFRWPSYLP
jgi:hypothetical protein